jgi:hypothetical protein
MNYIIPIVIILIIVVLFNNLTTYFATRDEFYNTVDSSIYFKSLNEQDLLHRNSTSIDNYINKYKLHYVDFTLGEKIDIYSKVLYLYTILPRKLANLQYKFVKIKFNNEIELSFPHTIGNLIILNEWYFVGDSNDKYGTIIHELMHVYQRKYPHDTERLVNALGFHRVDENIKNAVEILPLPFASNSDLRNVYYVIVNGTHLVLHTIYHQGRLRDICIGYNMTVGRIDFNSRLVQQGHPYEIIAEIVARIILKSEHVACKWIDIVNYWLYN